MKLKMNKVSDLSSFSVLPPPSRRLSSMPSGPQTSQFQNSLSQQQSFSQGISSQHGMFSQGPQLRSLDSISQGLSSQPGPFSQVSQSPLDNVLPNDRGFNSQERENTVKRASCFPAICYPREETQMIIPKPPSNLPHQKNDEIDHRLGVFETTLNKFGMILDSIQGDIIQMNRGAKQASVEMEGIQKKLNTLETSLQQLIKGQEDYRSSCDTSLKLISEQLSKDTYQDTLQKIFLVLSDLPEQIKASLLNLQAELRRTFTKETQAMAASWKTKICPKSPSVTVLPVKVCKSTHDSQQRKPDPTKNFSLVPVSSSTFYQQRNEVPKVETGGWKSVRVDRATSYQKAAKKEQKHVEMSSIKQERQCRVVIDSDEEIDGFFSCLVDEKNTGINTDLISEAAKDTERILRKARVRKRKSSKSIIIL